MVGLGLPLLLAAWALLVNPAASGGATMAGLVLTAVVGWVVGMAGARVDPVRVSLAIAATVGLTLLLGLPGSLTGSAGAGPLGYANANAALVTAAVAALLNGSSLVRDERLQRRLVMAAAAFGVAAVATGSRAGIVSCLLLFLTWRYLPRWSARTWQLVSAAVLAVGFGLTLVLATTLDHTRSWLVNITFSEVRVALWADAVEMARSHLVTGVGPGEFAHLSAVARSDPDLRWAHSAPLQVLAELGLVGLVLLAGTIVWMILRMGRMSVVLAVLALQPMIDYVLAFHLVMAVYAVTLGSVAANAQLYETSARRHVLQPHGSRPA